MSEKTATIDLRRLALADLKPHPRNPREHPDPGSAEWEILKRSLTNSYFDPLVWNENNGMLVSGHLRIRLLQDLGYTHAHVSVVNFDEAMHLAVMIIANKHGGDFNAEILKGLVVDIDAAGLDAALAGFEEKAFAEMLDCPPVADDTAIVEELLSKADVLQQKWKVQLGDLYHVGNHRVICGDSGSVDNWHRLNRGQLLDGLWVDPVYNVDYGAAQERRKIAREGTELPQPLKNDNLPLATYAADLKAWFQAAAIVTKPGGAVYVAHADSRTEENRSALRDAGFYYSETLIWVKTAFTLTRHDYHYQHEPILYGWREGGAHYFQGGYCHSTVIEKDPAKLHKKSKAELLALVRDLLNARDSTVVIEPRNTANDLHPTMKPPWLVARQVWNSTRKDELVGDFALGSGTTLVACQQIGRRCHGMDLDPKYVAVTLERAAGLGLQVEKEIIT